MKFNEVVKKIFDASLQNNLLEPKIPYTHLNKNIIKFCIVNRNHNFKYRIARDVSETEQVTGQKLYDILSKYLDCLKKIEKINDEQSLVFKNQLEEFKDK